jgi:PAP2 superfamily
MNIGSQSTCKGDGRDLDKHSGQCGFGPEDWVEGYSTLHQASPKPPLFDASCLALEPPPADIAQQCRALLDLQRRRTPRREKQIEAQAQANGEFLPLIKALGLAEYYKKSNPSRDLLVGTINQNILQPTFVFKRLFLRARPVRMCKKLRPMFSREHRYHPGHPAYPSGHSTTVYAWAYLLGSKLAFPHRALAGKLLAAAKAVAVNREWAGVHYASDTEAGRLLGKQIADAIVDAGSLSRTEYELLMPGLT